MFKIRNLVFGCAMGIASALAPIGAAQAVPLAVPKVETKSDVTQAQVEFCYGYGCDRRYYRRHYQPRYDGYYNERRYYRPRYERPRYYGGGRRAHVDWCSSRYRTYDPYTNRYHAGGGVYRLCYSPYR